MLSDVSDKCCLNEVVIVVLKRLDKLGMAVQKRERRTGAYSWEP